MRKGQLLPAPSFPCLFYLQYRSIYLIFVGLRSDMPLDTHHLLVKLVRYLEKILLPCQAWKKQEMNGLPDQVGYGYLCSNRDLPGFYRSRDCRGFHFCSTGIPVIVIYGDIDRSDIHRFHPCYCNTGRRGGHVSIRTGICNCLCQGLRPESLSPFQGRGRSRLNLPGLHRCLRRYQ